MYCYLQTDSSWMRVCKYLSFLGNTIACNKIIKWNNITKGREVVKEKISDIIVQKK